MIKHIVFFKLEDNSDEHKNKIKSMLLGLKSKIEVLRYIEVGLNFDESDRAYDMALITDFDTKEDLKTYQIHNDHQEVVSYLVSKQTVSKVVDYEY
jgi:hypothetical protein